MNLCVSNWQSSLTHDTSFSQLSRRRCGLECTLICRSLIRGELFYLSPFPFISLSFVGLDVNKSQILRFMLFSLAFSNPQTSPLGLFVRITECWQGVLEKPKSLFIYHYLLIPTPSSPVRQWIRLICKSQRSLIFCGGFPRLNRLVLIAKVPKQRYEKRKSQWQGRSSERCRGKERRGAARRVAPVGGRRRTVRRSASRARFSSPRVNHEANAAGKFTFVPVCLEPEAREIARYSCTCL